MPMFGQARTTPALNSSQAEDRNIVEAEQTSSLIGTVLTLGGAYGLYLLGLQSTAITTIGAIATAGSVLYKLGLLGGGAKR